MFRRFFLSFLFLIFLANVSFASKITSVNLPFVKNSGEYPSKVKFYAQTFAGDVFITEKGNIVYAFPAKDKLLSLYENITNNFFPNLKGLSKLKSSVNYFKNGKTYKRNETYGKVYIGKIGEDIDVFIKAHLNNVEKIFKLKSGDSVDKIKLSLKGIKGLELGNKGELVVQTELGNIKFSKPNAYQSINGKKVYIPVTYKILSNNEYSFSLKKYDKNYPVYIDPLIASAIIGGSDSDSGKFVNVDNSGNVYILGDTMLSSFPTFAGTINNAKGLWDIFVAKFSSDLQLLSTALIGGSNEEHATAVTIDSENNLYILGDTSSQDLSPYQTFYGVKDIFLVKLNPSLTQLLNGATIGGNSVDVPKSMKIDSNGNIFITGYTYSNNFPLVNAYDSNKESDLFKGFVVKFTPSFQIAASTFFGGNPQNLKDDYLYSLAIDSDNNVYVAGKTKGSNLPVSDNATQQTLEGGSDAFIAEFNNNLTTLLAATYLGGTEDDEAVSISVNASGDVVVAGNTYSSGNSMPVKSNSYQKNNGGSEDAFIAVLNNKLTECKYFTFFGSSGYDEIYSTDMDKYGNIFIGGRSYSSDLPIPDFAYQKKLNGDNDAFIAKFSPLLDNLTAATYLGGEDNETLYSLKIGLLGNIYATGITTSDDFPANNSYGSGLSGNSNAFVVKFNNSLSADNNPPVISSISKPEKVFKNVSAAFVVNAHDNDGSIIEYKWDFGDGNIIFTKTDTISHIYSDTGDYTLQVTVFDNDNLSAEKSLSFPVEIYNAPPVIDSFTSDTTKGASPLTVNFSVNAHDIDGSISEYRWDFDNDGNIDEITQGNTVSHIFEYWDQYVGNFITTVWVVDNSNNKAFATKTITVYPPNKVQVIDNFTATPESGNIPLKVDFHVKTHIDNGEIKTIKIDYNGDGKFDNETAYTGQTSVDQYFHYTYLNGGEYNAEIVVTNGNDYEVNKFLKIQAISPNKPPVIDAFSSDNSSGYAPLTVKFSVTAHDPDSSIESYFWDFNGDGMYDNETMSNEITHTYKSPGVYQATVQVKDDKGSCSQKSLLNINVLNNPPVINVFSATPEQGVNPLNVTFQVSATDVDGTISKCTFFDGINSSVNYQSCDNLSFIHTYSNVGIYYPSIKVFDNNGAYTVKSLKINVSSGTPPPVIDNFTANPMSGDAPLKVKFSITAHDIDGTIAGYGFDPLGTGNIEYPTTNSSFTYTYQQPGTYYAKAVVMDNDKQYTWTTPVKITVTTANKPPFFDNVTYDKSSGDAPMTVTFSVNAHDEDGTITKYLWDFNNDGKVDNVTMSKTITHTFTIGGEYNVSVKIEDNEGAVTTYWNTIPIHVQTSNKKPVINSFNATPQSGNSPLDVTFTVDATDEDGSITYYKWDFNDDGNIDKVTETPGVTYTYATPGIFNATVKVYDNSGEYSLSQPVEIEVKNVPPVLKSFSAAPSNGAYPLKVKFNAYGKDPNGSIKEYLWDFNGDGFIDNKTSIGYGIYHTYYQPGVYEAYVTIVDNNNATVTSKPVFIKVVPFSDMPVIDSFTADYSEGENPVTVLFTVNAHDNGEIVKYLWDFNGDGMVDNVSSTGSIQYTYNNEGIFSAKVTVVDNNGNKVDSDYIYISTSGDYFPPVIDSVKAEPLSGNAPLTVNFTVNAHETNGTISSYELDPFGNGMNVYDFDNNTFSFTYEKPGVYKAKIAAIDKDGAVVNSTIYIHVTGSFTLNVSKTGNGNGDIISEPEGILCGDNCSGDFEAYEKVTLHAAQFPGSTFFGWTGDCVKCGIIAKCNIVMSKDKQCTALFITDSDGDGINDLLEGFSAMNDPKKINLDLSVLPSQVFDLIGLPASFKGGSLSIETDKGNIKVNSDFSNVPILNIKNPKYKFPYAVISFEITGLTAGDNATVIITLPDNATIPPNTEYVKIYKDNSSKVFSQDVLFSSNDKTNWTKGLVPGDKYIKLILTDGGDFDEDGSANGVIKDPSGLAIVNTPPEIINFTVDNASGGSPLVVNFNVDANDSDGKIIKYLWDFNGDNNSDLTTLCGSVSYTYKSPGDYNAKVTVVDDNLAKTTSKPITVIVKEESNTPDNSTENGTIQLKLHAGWNLIALPVNEVLDNLSLFNNITTLWSWDGNTWKIYSPVSKLSSLILSYGIKTIDELTPGKGYWINSPENLIVNFVTGAEYGVEKISLSSGWNLCGIGKDINVNSIANIGDIKTVWKWSGSTWEIWSPVSEIKELITKFGIVSFNGVKKGEGFWVNK